MANEQQGMPGLELASAGPEDAGATDEGPTAGAEAKEAVASRGAASDVGSAVSVSAGTASSSARGESKQPAPFMATALHRMPLVAAVAMLLCGVGLAELLRDTALTAWLGNWSFTFPAIVCGGLGMRALVRAQRRLAAMWGLLALVCVGATHHHVQSQRPHDDFALFATRDYQPLVFRAEIIEPAIWRPNGSYRASDPTSEQWRTQWRVRCTAVRDGLEWRAAKCTSTLSVAGRIEELLPGDRIQVYGACCAVHAPTNPGEGDLRLFFAREQQFVFLRAESGKQIELLERSWSRPVRRCIGIVVQHLDRVVRRWVILDQAPLAAALIFGQRQQVDWDEQQQLLSTGTLHMLAISGMHVELVAWALLSVCLLLGVGQRWTLVIVSTTVVLYGLISGANPPVLRAVFVVLAACVARWSGKRSSMANLLGFAGVMLLAMRTSWMANVGVQLSFLAVATIGLYAGVVDARAERVKALQSLVEESWTWQRKLLAKLMRSSWDLLRISFWVWLITAPLIWHNFNVLSIVAVPLNVVLWLFLLVSLLSGLVLCVTWWFPPLAWILGVLCGLCLWIISAFVWLGDRLPASHVWMPAPPLWWMVVFYAIAAAGSLLIVARPRWRGALAGVLSVWLIIGMSPWLIGTHGHGPRWLAGWIGELPVLSSHEASEKDFRATFIDVGHGTSVMLELPGGEILLYDAGHLGSPDRSHQEIASALWHVRTARVERLFISHADADHYNAVDGLRKRFTIGDVVAPPQFWTSTSPEVKAIVGSLASAGIHSVELSAPQRLEYGEVTMDVLHPPVDWKDSSDNGDSLTLLISVAGRRLLLPGDLEKGGMRRLLSEAPVDCDVVMAPHHGSLTHDPKDLLAWCTPEWVVISGGQRAARETVEEHYTPPGGCAVVTHRLGAVQVRVSEHGELSLWHWDGKGWERIRR